MDAVGGGTAGTSGPQSPAFASVSNSTVTIVYAGRPFACSLKTAWVPLGKGVTDPSRLLRARSAVVPYLDPAGHLDVLRHWLSGPEPFSVRLVGGRGGSGKTRLAVELCRAAARENWAAGLLGPFRPESIPSEQTTGDTGPGMLVVIDYAETRTSELEIVLLALQQAAGPARRVRVLLLVRRAPKGTDWTDVLRTGEEELDAILDTAAPHEVILDEAAWDFGAREDLYCSSWKAFAERSENTSGISPTATPPPDLTAARFGNPLLVAATAYLAVHDPGGAMPDTWEGLLDGILAHEAGHWAHADRPADPDGTVTRRATAMAALAGADDETEGAGLLYYVPDLQDAGMGTRMAWARWYRRFYPGARFWNPLEPDLLGEHLIATTLTEFPASLAATVDAARGPNTGQPLIVLARISATSQAMDAYPGFNTIAAHALQTHLTLLTRAAVNETADPKTGLPVAGLTIAAALAQAVNALSPQLEDVSESIDALPPRSVPHLHALAVALTQHHVSWLRSRIAPGTNAPAVLAMSLNYLSNRLADTGDRDGALHAIREALDIRRDLAGADPAAYADDLAMTLNNFSNHLAATGDHGGALHAIREAVDIRRALTEADPDSHKPGLAGCLNNLSSCLSNTGDHVGALLASHETVALYRGLTATEPAAYTPDLAMSLNNLSSCLADAGDFSGALHTGHEAVSLYRRLAAAEPAAYTPNLATALNNLSIRLGRTGDPDGALHALREAIDIRRALASAHPAAYTHDLAMSLNNLATCLTDTGDRDGALHAIREAVDILQGLTDTRPAIYTSHLAAALHNLSACLAATGDRDGALHAIREAVDIRQALADAHPAAHAPDLATALNSLSACLAAVGDHVEALNAVREAVGIRRGLADAYPTAYTPDLAMSLNSLSTRLAGTRERKVALDAIHEAVTLYRGLVGAHPATYTPDLAMTLNNLSTHLADAGDHDGALNAIHEAVPLYRGLAGAHPATYTPDLATALNNLSIRLAGTGDHDGALNAIREAIDIRRALVIAHPAAYTPDLAMSVNNLSKHLADTGDHDGALQTSQEAVALYRGLAIAHPAAYTPGLAMSLNNLSHHLADNGDLGGALHAIREALDIRRR